MDLTDALLDSWDRQCRIVKAVAGLVDEGTRHVKPSEDGWPLDLQLAHIHGVRREWLTAVAPESAASLTSAFEIPWEKAIQDLDAIKAHLDASALALREGVGNLLKSGQTGPVGGYDHPLLLIQHMVWHEGWHVGLIFLGLRLAGKEPSGEWEENNVWGEWRVE